VRALEAGVEIVHTVLQLACTRSLAHSCICVLSLHDLLTSPSLVLTIAKNHTMGIASRKPYSAPAHAASRAGGRNITVNQMYNSPKMTRPAAVFSWIQRMTLCRLSLRPNVKEVAMMAPGRHTAVGNAAGQRQLL
jgi:hypothetical protein